jgi:triacylglycerol lipase
LDDAEKLAGSFCGMRIVMAKEKNVFFGLVYWVLGFCGIGFLVVFGKLPPVMHAAADRGRTVEHVASIPVSGYDPAIVRRMAIACAATYQIDQPGGATKSANYGVIGFKGKPTTAVRDDINAALVGTTDHEIVVAFRGALLETHTFDQLVESVYDWANDVDVKLISDKSISPGRVHQGFRDAYKSLWDVVLADVQSRREHSRLPVIVTGHSKGGALARLAALGFLKVKIPVAGVYTFGAPRAGDLAFAQDYESRIKHDFRFENTDDVVPHTPPTKRDTADLLTKRSAGLKVDAHDEYQHVGRLQYFDWEGNVQDASPELDAQRTKRLHSGAYELHQLEKLAADHSLEYAYQPRLVKLVRE